jgi:hypothetical protein
VGGGAGHRALPLARHGYRVTIVHPLGAMLSRAHQLLSSEPEEVAARVRLIEAPGEGAPPAVGGQRYAGVLCHRVLIYLDDSAPLVSSLAEWHDQPGFRRSRK